MGEKFCKNCGNKLTEGSIFCSKCGTKIGSTSSQKYPFENFIELIECEDGTFVMGSPAQNKVMGIANGELGRSGDESQFQAIISKSFKIGKFPVTQKQYKEIMGINPSFFKGDNNPVDSVSWYDAKMFCDKLNQKYANALNTGYRFDLPTEAQWEYACRAESTSALNNGTEITKENGICPNLEEVGWYNANSRGSTHPVGLKKPNNWGIYDMHGNVFEWCKDWYNYLYPSAPTISPSGSSSGTEKVCRGGSWNDNAKFCRSASRFYSNPRFKNYYFGFRVVLTRI